MSTTTLTPPSTPPTQRVLTPGHRLLIAALLALGCIALFFIIDSGGDLAFTLEFRGRKVAGMVLVGWATGMATVAFQTVTHNRILTPSVMGLDALYAFVQTLFVVLLGVSLSTQLGPVTMFGLNLVIMMGFGMLLASLLVNRRTTVHLLVLIGIVVGTLLRSLQSLLTRVMDPTSFLVLQGNLFASFNIVDGNLLAISAALILAASAWLWWRRHELDVMSLGNDAAQGLGVNPARMIREVLLISILLVSLSTALVGPITFLGLIVANVAYLIAGSGKHGWTMPMASLLAVGMLVGGQAILEHVFGLATVLSVIIEFGGGLVFIWLVVRGSSMKGGSS